MRALTVYGRVCCGAVLVLIGGIVGGGCAADRGRGGYRVEEELASRRQDQEASMQRAASAMQAYRDGDLERAREGLREAVRRSDRNVSAWNALGVVSLHLGEVGEAVGAFERASALAPGSFEPHFNLGTAMESIGRYGEAITAYEASLALSPGSLEVMENLARVYVRSGRQPDRALALIDEALVRESRPDWRGWLELQRLELRRRLERPGFEPADNLAEQGGRR